MAAKLVNKEQLIESVRKLPCLYDTSRKEYKDEMLPCQTINRSIKTYYFIKRERQYSETKAASKDL